MKKTFSNTSIRAIALSLLFIVSGVGASVLISPAARHSQHGRSFCWAAPSRLATPLTQAQRGVPERQRVQPGLQPPENPNKHSTAPGHQLELYPLPSMPTSLSSLGSGVGGTTGVEIDPLIVNGTAFAMTEFDEVFAFNLANGNALGPPVAAKSQSDPGRGLGKCPGFHAHDGCVTFAAAGLR